MTPVFVHSSFRTSSTWLWSKFRGSDRNLAFYEVFNPGLATLRAEDIPNLHPAQWRSRHPPGAPYFIEFSPLIRPEGGIKAYDPAMAEAQFIPLDGIAGSLAPNEVDYLGLLTGHARSMAKIPVLTATRSLGRIAAIRRELGGVHLLIYRNLFRQWCSYAEQFYQGNPYFINTVSRIIEASNHDPFLAAIASAYQPAPEPAPDAHLFYPFALLHLYLYAAAAAHCDLRIDCDRLTTVNYRTRLEAEAATLLGQRLDFSDAKPSIGFILDDLPPSGRIATVLTDGIASIRSALPAFEPSVGVFLRGLVDDLLNEYEQWQFYGERLKEHFLARQQFAPVFTPSERDPAAHPAGEAG